MKIKRNTTHSGSPKKATRPHAFKWNMLDLVISIMPFCRGRDEGKLISRQVWAGRFFRGTPRLLSHGLGNCISVRNIGQVLKKAGCCVVLQPCAS